MTDTLPLTIVCDDAEAYLSDVWTALKTRSEESGEIRIADDQDEDDWDHFQWKSLGQVAVKGFDPERASTRPTAPDLPNVEIRYDTSPFRESAGSRDDAGLAGATVDLLNLGEFAYGAGSEPPACVYGVGEEHQQRLADGDVPPPVTPESVVDDCLEYTPWLLVAPPPMAERYGREKLLSAPAWQTEELPEGGAALAATQEPIARTKPETRAIDDHLDLEPPGPAKENPY